MKMKRAQPCHLGLPFELSPFELLSHGFITTHLPPPAPCAQGTATVFVSAPVRYACGARRGSGRPQPGKPAQLPRHGCSAAAATHLVQATCHVSATGAESGLECCIHTDCPRNVPSAMSIAEEDCPDCYAQDLCCNGKCISPTNDQCGDCDDKVIISCPPDALGCCIRSDKPVMPRACLVSIPWACVALACPDHGCWPTCHPALPGVPVAVSQWLNVPAQPMRAG